MERLKAEGYWVQIMRDHTKLRAVGMLIRVLVVDYLQPPAFSLQPSAFSLFLIILPIFFTVSCATAPHMGPADDRLHIDDSVFAAPPGKGVATDIFSQDKPPEKPTELPPYTEISPLEKESPPASQPRGEVPSFSPEKQVQVTFDTMPLNEFVHHIFGDVLAVNYLMSEQVSQNTRPITLNLKHQVSEEQLFNLTKDLLLQEKIAIVTKEGIFYILPQVQAESDVQIGIGRLKGDIPQTAGEILQLVPLRYVSVSDISSIVTAGLKISVLSYVKENILAIRGTRTQIEGVLAFLELLDRPSIRGHNVALISLSYWWPKEIIPALADALVQEGIPVGKQAGDNGVFFLPLERLAAMLVFASEKVWIARVQEWVQLLDRPNQTTEKSYYVYTPEYATAKDLGKSVAAILGMSRRVYTASTLEGDGPAGRQDHEAAGGLGQGQTREPGKAMSAVDMARSAGGAAAKARGMAGGKPATGEASEDAASEVRFAVDDTRNALIFYCTAKSFEEIRKLLQRLDQMPLQVAIDASVMEVTLTDSLSYGFEWFLKETMGSSSVSVLGHTGGPAGSIQVIGLFNNSRIGITLDALAKENLIKVLSNPKLIVRDGKSASIVVGTEVPVVTSEATSATLPATQEGAAILRSIQYRSTGVSLAVTPTVNAHGVVTMEISQEVSEASSNNTSEIDSPIILNRSITTEVVTADGQTVVLGGLIKENNSGSETSIPWLGKVPFLGAFFRSESTGHDRTELVVFITPRIIRSSEQIETMKRELMEGFDKIGWKE